MFKVDFSFKGLIAQLNRIAGNHRPRLRNNIERAALLFIGDIQSKQMSGRKGSRYTNVKTGTLRRDWFYRIIENKNDIGAEIFSTTSYAPYQEYGTSKQHRRLYIREAWKRDGLKSMRQAAIDALRGIKRNGINSI
jgi:hypothetical protein